MTQPTIYSVAELYLFQTFNSRDEYRRATGLEPPPYDPARRPKNWLDARASASPRMNVVYDHVLALGDSGSPIVDGAGIPIVEPLVLSKEEAGRVNIFEHGLGYPAPAAPPMPVPLRALEDFEELIYTFPAGVMVRDKRTIAPEDTGFTESDRRLLKAIATKLEVIP